MTPLVRMFLFAALWIVHGDVDAYAFTPHLRPVACPHSGSGGRWQHYGATIGTPCAARTPKATAEGVGDTMNPSGGGGAEPWYTCRNCKQRFQQKSNTEGACSFHPGLFSGRLNRVNDVDTSGLEYFWSCCGETDKSHPGCVVGRHATYDDPSEGGDGSWRSPLTGMLRSSSQ